MFVIIIINIDDVNDVKFVFKLFLYDFFVKEYIMLVIIVGKVEVIDGDEGENFKLFYSIVILWKGGEGMFVIN